MGVRTGRGSGGVDAAELHRQAIAETERGRHSAARRLLDRALRAGPEPALRAHILISLAYHAAERRSVGEGIALLGQADAVPGLPRRLRGLVASQRGLLYMRAGAAGEAVEGFDEALRLLDESEPQDLCRALLNRGLLAMQQGRYASARADYARCTVLARRHGLDLLGAKASHNLGYLWLLHGNLPRALREMDAVAPVLTGESPVHAAVYYVDRAQVLLAAGLFPDADADLARAVELFRAGGVRQDRAEAELARAQVALAQERHQDARRLAGQARRRFAGRGAAGWALLASYVAVAARVAQGVGLAHAATEAMALGERLLAAGLEDEARRARLTAALAILATGSASGGGAEAGAPPPPAEAAKAEAAKAEAAKAEAATAVAGDALRLRRGDPIATRLQARQVRARLAEARGAPGLADRERHAGLVDLHAYQASFGSLDLRTAVSAHGRRLAAEGLARALATGRPATVFRWAEQARATAARLPPVLPPADAEAAGLLEELRFARAEVQAQALAGRADPALKLRCARLEQRIRQRAWYAPGPGQAIAPAPLRDLQAQIAAAGGAMVAHLLSEDRLYALVVTGDHRAVRDLGPAAPVLEWQQRLRHDLDALALRHLPGPVRDSVGNATRTALARLEAALWQPVRDLAGAGPLLLAPSAALAALPWTLVPALRDRPLTVVASVTAWLQQRDRSRLRPAPTIGLAAGPGVARGLDELRLVAKTWSRPEPVAEATASEVRDAAGTADVLHVAAHGVHQPDNPFFSHLDLADGPLFGHELKHLARLPSHVVLSACELGRSGTRPGDETLGMTAALLYGGAGSVVSGVARIADAVAYQVAPAHHAGLSRGLSPAAALAQAIGALDPEVDPAPLVCFGAGW